MRDVSNRQSRLSVDQRDATANEQEACDRRTLKLRQFAHSRITLVHALVGAAWIFASDRALEWLGVPVEQIGRLQTYKGWLYVAVTTFMLYLLIEYVTRTVVAHMTERVQLEERLRRGQRLESLGRMASGVAHDFNNILFTVSGGCELLLREPLTPGARELASQIEQASASAEDLVAQLLAFARQQPRAPSPLTLESAVRRAEPILKRLVAEPAQLQITLSPPHGKVLADASQLEQVLLNLVTNAAHAIGKRGRVSITTDSVQLSEAEAREADLPAGHYEMLSVADTGGGIPEDVLSHIFEPFFTTKGEGGTGLGLATVYSIVRQSGGGVLVSSTPGQGTELRVLLPRVAEQAAA